MIVLDRNDLPGTGRQRESPDVVMTVLRTPVSRDVWQKRVKSSFPADFPAIFISAVRPPLLQNLFDTVPLPFPHI